MRNFDAATIAALAAPDVRLVMFIQFDYTTGSAGSYTNATAHLCTASHDIVWNGQTWTGGGSALSVEEITEKSGVESTGVQVVINGVPSDMLSLALQAYVVGRLARIYIGAYTEAGALVATPWLEFEGRCDTFEIQDDPKNARIILSLESKLVILQEPEDRLWTHAEQQKTYPTDQAFKFVNATVERTLAWGPRR